MDKAYLSEIDRWWTLDRQRELLAERVAGWGNRDKVQVYTDTVNNRQRRSRMAEWKYLPARADMIRPTSRPAAYTIYVASPAILGWNADDVRAFQASLDHRARVFSVEDGCVVTDLVEAWQKARTKSRLEGAAKRGGAMSAKVRGERVAAAVALIADRWPLPSKEWPTAALLKEAGVSRNGVNARLGGREKAQARYQAALKRKMRRNPDASP